MKLLDMLATWAGYSANRYVTLAELRAEFRRVVTPVVRDYLGAYGGPEDDEEVARFVAKLEKAILG